MKNFFFIFFKTILYTFIFLGIFNSSFSKVNEFNFDAKNISNYFSGIISFDDLDYNNSQKFLKRLDDFENKSLKYSSRLMQSLINLEKFKEAYSYSRKLEKKNLSNFESNLFLGLYEFKRKKYDKAKFYFDKLENNFEHRFIYDILKISLNTWVTIGQSKDSEAINLIEIEQPAYVNLARIQKAFAFCYKDDPNTGKEFKEIISNEESNFSRYHFFFANYLNNKNKKDQATRFIETASEKYPGNLLINQFKKNINNKMNLKDKFNCGNTSDILGEILYVFANAMSSQREYKLSNLYINLSKFLNPKFKSYDTLLAENYIILKRNKDAEKIYKKISSLGSIYKWYSAKKNFSNYGRG